MSSESITRDGVTVECITGDITRQPDLEAITNAANAQLRIGGGVAGAIHRAAGPQLDEECRPLAPIAPGDAVITGAGDLPNRYVVHTLGPVYGHDRPEAQLLAMCYRNSLMRAEEKGLTSIGFPAISTGAFGYPMADAAKLAMETMRDSVSELRSLRLIRFVLFSDRDRQVHRRALSAAFSDSE
jgi:O-acetyl-ADP-ribose deacetylase (regulator of RNase III)